MNRAEAEELSLLAGGLVEQVLHGQVQGVDYRDAARMRELANLAETDVGPDGVWGWQGDPDGGRPAPEDMECFAHWSTVHPGVNVELTVPGGLHLTVHVNDNLAVDLDIGDPIPEGWPAHRKHWGVAP